MMVELVDSASGHPSVPWQEAPWVQRDLIATVESEILVVCGRDSEEWGIVDVQLAAEIAGAAWNRDLDRDLLRDRVAFGLIGDRVGGEIVVSGAMVGTGTSGRGCVDHARVV